MDDTNDAHDSSDEKNQHNNTSEANCTTIELKLPNLKDHAPITDNQKETLARIIGNEDTIATLNQAQASLLLDIIAYFNGVWYARTGKREFPSKLVQVFAISAILEKEAVWRAVRSWGRARFRSGRYEAIPTLRQDSDLFRQVWNTVYSSVEQRQPANPVHVAPPRDPDHDVPMLPVQGSVGGLGSARRRAKCWKCGKSMYRDEMVKVFGHGLQSGYKRKGSLLYGHDIVVCPNCVSFVKVNNRNSNIVGFVVVGVLFVAMLIAALVQGHK